MTSAPENLRQLRSLLLAHLEPYGLSSGSVGIVGDANHRGGYHCGSDRVLRNADGSIRDYSVIESQRDRGGLTLDAAGLDVGLFAYGRHTLHTFSVWCVAQCKANTPDSRDIREIIYSPDGVVVRRWDRLGRRSSGDVTHLWHTHFSFFRDAIKAGRDQTPLFRRYLTDIGLLEDDVTEDQLKAALREVLTERQPYQASGPRARLTAAGWRDQSVRELLDYMFEASQLDADGKPIAGVGRALYDRLGALDMASPEQIAEAIAAALPVDLARQVSDELARRLAS